MRHSTLRRYILWAALILLLSPAGCAFHILHHQRSVDKSIASRNHPLYANDSKSARKRGVYSRPSAAIERGSGFFIPGLEGPKIRIVLGCALLMLTAINNSYSDATLFSDGLAAVYSFIVLLQASIEYLKEQQVHSRRTPIRDDIATDATRIQVWSIPSDERWKERVEWAALSYISLTRATYMLLLGPEGKILYYVGPNEPPSDSETTRSACRAALDSVNRSLSGRISLKSHPVTELVPNRCIVVQRIDQSMCWMMASDQLLAAFAKQDLQWLGQLAKYVARNDT